MQWLLAPGNRLLTAVITAALVFLLSPSWLTIGPRVVLAWNSGVIVLLGLIAIMMWKTPPHETLSRARHEETSSVVILLATVLAVGGALVGIGYGLPETTGMSERLRDFDIFESVIGVFLAWSVLHVMYSLHYAKQYYAEVSDNDRSAFRKGLVFPGDKDVVDYWDFVYYSFTIAMCFQTSDVTVTSPHMRRLTICHAVVSYLFALAILGLMLGGFISDI
jgi:uncharacterized membrane protein